MKLGKSEIYPLRDGLFRLDGGAMFGVVPRVLWERASPPDERNRIAMALGCLLIKSSRGRWILVDTGLSSKYEHNQKFLRIYGVERSRTLLDELKDLGLEASDIKLVINTHLHFDHCGGNTLWDENKKPIPAFPKAKYIVQKKEWEDAANPNERTQASYLPENFECLGVRGQMEFVDGVTDVEPGIQARPTGGHTRGHQCVVVESEGKGAIFLGDLIPMRPHLNFPWIMGYDTYPLETLNVKKKILEEAQQRQWLLVFQHDPEVRFGYLSYKDGQPLLSNNRF